MFNINMAAYADTNNTSFANLTNVKVNTSDSTTVYFGEKAGEEPYAWRIIGLDGTGAVGSRSGALTLFAKENLNVSSFAFDGNAYSSDYLNKTVNGIADKLSTKEKDAVIKRTLISGTYDGANTDCVAGPEVKDAVMWPLSAKEALSLDYSLRAAEWKWWLRSPHYVKSSALQIQNGELYDIQVRSVAGVRPAFYLNFDSILFASDVAGGKTSGTPGENALTQFNLVGDECKLTILDKDRSFRVISSEYDGNAKSVSINYDGATLFTPNTPYEYISAIIKAADGKIKYYGRVLQPTTETGTFALNLAGVTMDSTDKLYVFSEQYHDSKFTDYASALSEVVLTPNSTQYGIRITDDGYGKVTASPAMAAAGTEVTLSVTEKPGYCITELNVLSPSNLTINNNKFTMPNEAVKIEATFGRDFTAPTAKTLSYTGTPQKLVNDGELHNINGTMKYSLSEDGEYSATVPEKRDVGTYTVYYKVVGGSYPASYNFDRTKGSVSVTISKGEQGDFAINEVKGKKYGGSEFFLETTGGNGNGAVTYSVPENNGILELDGNKAKILGVGEVTVKAVKAADDNYNEKSAERRITIAKGDKPAITFPTAASLLYGQKLSASKLSGGSTEYGSFQWVNGDTLPTIVNSGYEVAFTPNEATVKNYEAFSESEKKRIVELSVAKGDIPHKAPKARVLKADGTEQALVTAGTVSVGGIGNFEYSLDENGAYSADIPKKANAGTYRVYYRVVGTNTNYNYDSAKGSVESIIATENQYIVTVTNDGNGTATASKAAALYGAEIELTPVPNRGYHFKEWQVTLPASGLTVNDNKFQMPHSDVRVKAVFEKNAATEPQASTSALANLAEVKVNTADAATVYFGKDGEQSYAWRIIGLNGEGAVSRNGALTLLARENLATSNFDDWNGDNIYSTSLLRGKLNEITDKLSTKEKDAILKRTLISGEYNGDNTDCIAGPEVKDAAMCPLSAKEAHSVNGSLRWMSDNNWAMYYWWLRSPGNSNSKAQIVNSKGVIDAGGYSVSKEYVPGVRPALYLNLDSIILVSSATGEKTSGEVGSNALREFNVSGTEYKLTILDEDRNFRVLSSQYYDSTKRASIKYESDTVYDVLNSPNEYISAIVKSSNGNVKYYGRVLQPRLHTGTFEIDISDLNISDTDRLYVFSEKDNGDKATDYASSLYEVNLLSDSEKYGIEIKKEAKGNVNVTPEMASENTEVILMPTPEAGYYFKVWQAIYPSDLKIIDNKFIMPSENVIIKAIFAKEIIAPTAKTLAYNGQEQELVNAGSVVIAGTMKYSLSEDGEYSADIPKKKDAGTYTVYYKVDNLPSGYDENLAKGSVEVIINKLPAPAITFPTIGQLTYGQKLSESTMTDESAEYGSFAWTNGDIVPTVQNNGYELVFTPNEATTKNYEPIAQSELKRVVTVTVNRAAAPEIEFPTATDLSYGDKLSASQLRGGSVEYGSFAWKDKTIARQVDNTGYEVVFTPKDVITANYEPIEESNLTKKVKVKVAKAEVQFKAPAARKLTYNGAEQALVIGGEIYGGAEGSFEYSLKENEGYSADIPKAKDAGTYTVHYRLTGSNTNYDYSKAKGKVEVIIAAPDEYRVTVANDGHGTGKASPVVVIKGREITLSTLANSGYQFKEWEIISPSGLTIEENKFTMPDSNVKVKAIFEKVAPATPTEPATQTDPQALSTTLVNLTNVKVNSGDATTLYFGKNGSDQYAWRIIGLNGHGVASVSGAATLLAAKSMGQTAFDAGNNGNNVYEDSSLRSKVTEIVNTLSEAEKAAVVKRTLKHGAFENDMPWIAGDKDIENEIMWPLSLKEAAGTNEVLRVLDMDWWLRSPLDRFYEAQYVGANGKLWWAGEYVYNSFAVRPAFYLNLDSILFASDAVGGKDSEGVGARALTEFSNEGTEYKLTVIDQSRNFKVTLSQYDKASEIVKIYYTGASVGTEEYISAIIKDTNGNVKFYGRVAQPTSEKGTFNVDLSSVNMTETDSLYVFSEQYNGDKETDYVSKLSEVNLSADFEKYEITFEIEGEGTATAEPEMATENADVTLTPTPAIGYHFKAWRVVSPSGVTVTDNKFEMPNEPVRIKAIFEKDFTLSTAKTLTYNGQEQELVNKDHINTVGGEIQYSLTEDGAYSPNVPKAKDAGSYTVYCKLLDTQSTGYDYSNAKGKVDVIIKKAAAPMITFPTAGELTYGQKLINSPLTGGSNEYGLFEWANDDIVPIVGNAGYDVVFKPSQEIKKNYEDFKPEDLRKNILVTVKKATAPKITFPTAGALTYGQKLSESSLSGGSTKYGRFAWENGELVPTVINQGYKVIFTPNEDALKNYETIAPEYLSKDIAITVAKAALKFDAPTAKALKYNGKEQELVTAGTVYDNGSGRFEYSLTETGEYSTASSKKATAGTYDVYYKIVGTDSNYDYGNAKGKVVVQIAAPDQHIVKITTVGNGTATATPSAAGMHTEITLNAIAGSGYHFKAWEVVTPSNLTIEGSKFIMPDSDVEVKAIFEKDAPTEHSIKVISSGNGKAKASLSSAVINTEVTLTANAESGYHFKAWEVVTPSNLTIEGSKFIMPDSDVEVKAIFEKDAPTAHSVTVIKDGNGTATASPSSAVMNTEITLTATADSGYHFKG